MNNQQTNQKGDFDEIIIYAFIAIAVIGFGYLFWIKLHTQIATLFLWLRMVLAYPFWVIYQFLYESPTLQNYMDPLVAPIKYLCAPVDWYNITSCTIPKDRILYKGLSKSSIFGNIFYSVIIVIILIKAWLKVERLHPERRFSKQHTLETFIDEMKVVQKHLYVFGDIDLNQYSNMEGMYRGMESTREFVYSNELVANFAPRIKNTKKLEHDVRFSINNNDFIPVINVERLDDILEKQLGNLYRGIDLLSDGELILLALYLPRACSTDSEMSDEEFKYIADRCVELENYYWQTVAEDIKTPGFIDHDNLKDREFHSFDINQLKQWLEPYLEYQVSKRLISKHAYTRTLIVASIYEARKLGVNAPTQIRWLKLYNRTLWAMVQNVGRPSMFCEGMGIIAHYQREAVYEKQVLAPDYSLLHNALEDLLSMYLYNKDTIPKEYIINIDS